MPVMIATIIVAAVQDQNTVNITKDASNNINNYHCLVSNGFISLEIVSN